MNKFTNPPSRLPPINWQGHIVGHGQQLAAKRLEPIVSAGTEAFKAMPEAHPTRQQNRATARAAMKLIKRQERKL